MDGEYYTAKEVMKKLGISSSTLHRHVRDGKIPYKPGRPKTYPKYPIDVIAGVKQKQIETKGLIFKSSTVADLWETHERVNNPNKDREDVSFKSSVTWNNKNREISMCVTEEQVVLGWVVFLPLKEKTMSELMQGTMKDGDIPEKAIKRWSDENISVYIPVLEVFPTADRARDKRIAACLLKNTIKWALDLKHQGDIQAWYTIVSRAKGQELVLDLGLEHVNTLDDGERECYRLRNDSPFPPLLQKFASEYEEMRKKERELRQEEEAKREEEAKQDEEHKRQKKSK